MKILYTSHSPLAGVCELMARTVMEYRGHEDEARVLNGGPGRHSWYVRPGIEFKKYSIKKQDEVNEALEWADVIHCMANVGVRFFNREDLLNKKVWIFQWHGAQIWPFSRVWKHSDYSKVRWIHIGQGWVETQWDFFRVFFEKYGAMVVPNIITADDMLHRPSPWENRKNKVGFAPSNRGLGVNRKGIDVVCSQLRGIQYDLIIGLKFEHCLFRKLQARLGIDEVVTPMYHRSGLEFLSQGTPCICSYTRVTEKVLKNATGSDTMPFIQASPKTLRSVVENYWRLPEEDRVAAGQNARKWIEKYYHPNLLLERYYDVYLERR